MQSSTLNDSSQKGWPVLIRQWGQDLRLFLLILAVLLGFRLIIFTYYGAQIGEATTASELLSAWLMGLRFDAATAASWVVLSFLAAMACLAFPVSRYVQGFRWLVMHLFVVVGIIILVFDFIFVGKYGDHFNQMIFGLWQDDTRAVLITIWKEFHPLLVLALLGVMIGLLRKLFVAGMRRPVGFGGFQAATGRWGKIVLFSSTVLLFFVVIRGSTINATPLQIHNSFITSDDFLNRMIPNPYASLRKTLKYRYQISGRGGVKAFWENGDIQTALDYIAAFRGERSDHKASVDDYFVQTAGGSAGKPPRHIFVILMESYSAWPLMPAYQQYGLANEGARLAKNGVSFRHFLPATRSTAESLNVLVTGLPSTANDISRLVESTKTYPSSLAAIFQRLGYTTRFFYGGYIGWRRIDLFIPNQGFQEVYGGGGMPTTLPANEWGVADGDLFRFVADTVDNDQPSVNFILTTTNHAPYDLDVKSLGFPLDHLPGEMRSTDSDALNVLGHHWYADQAMGQFVDKMAASVPDALFVITGDHTARMSLALPDSNAFVERAVPLILYGPDVLNPEDFDESVPGGHIDVIPTLVEMAAPAGFRYVGFAEGLQRRVKQNFGFGRDLVMREGRFFRMGRPQKLASLDAGHALGVQGPADNQRIDRYIKALKAASWYRSALGNRLTSQAE